MRTGILVAAVALVAATLFSLERAGERAYSFGRANDAAAPVPTTASERRIAQAYLVRLQRERLMRAAASRASAPDDGAWVGRDASRSPAAPARVATAAPPAGPPTPRTNRPAEPSPPDPVRVADRRVSEPAPSPVEPAPPIVVAEAPPPVAPTPAPPPPPADPEPVPPAQPVEEPGPAPPANPLAPIIGVLLGDGGESPPGQGPRVALLEDILGLGSTVQSD